MIRLFIERKKKILIIGGLIVAVCFVMVFATMAYTPSHYSGGSSSISLTSTSSRQQSVDTGLSLIPSSLPPISIPQRPLPLVYSGCKLSLGFFTTGGNLQATGSMSYTLTAKNIGGKACQSASISVYYAAGENYISATPAATADGYYWQLGDLTPGSERNIALTSIRTAALAAGNVTNEACLSADNADDACSNSVAASAIPANSDVPQASGIIPAITDTNGNSFPSSSKQEAGVWVWTSLSNMSTAQMQQIINEAATNNFTAIYITIDDYLTIAALPDGTEKQQKLQDYNNAIGQFLSLAAQKNIAVDAEAGWRDWAELQNTGEANRIMVFVSAYNQAHVQKFRGIQYDIEPYLLSQYGDDQEAVLTRYVQLIDQLVQQDKVIGLPLSVVVPHFYDSNEGWTPQVTVDGITAYTYAHILRLLNELPAGDGRIIIMAYRNFANGSDSAIALSSQEIKEADATNVKVLIAQETGPVPPSYVTFYGTSRTELFSQIGIINAAFASSTSFAGIAIDYLDPYLELQ